MYSQPKNKLSRFLDHQTLSLSQLFTGHLRLPPRLIPQKIVAPVTGDLSLKSRNLSLKAGSLRQTTAEAVSTKMVNFVPQQKHRTPGLKQKLKLCMKICNCQKICFVWLNLIFAKLYFPEATGI